MCHLTLSFCLPGQLASCETFPEQMGILGANTVKMLFAVPLACGITHCYAAEMEDSRPTVHDENNLQAPYQTSLPVNPRDLLLQLQKDPSLNSRSASYLGQLQDPKSPWVSASLPVIWRHLQMCRITGSLRDCLKQ